MTDSNVSSHCAPQGAPSLQTLQSLQLDGVSVLGSCHAAAGVARQAGLGLAVGQPERSGRYVVVVPDASGLELVDSAEDRGFVIVATVAWRLRATLVSRLAAMAVPVVVGLPTRQALIEAIVRNNTDEMRRSIARWMAVESHLDRPAVTPARPHALTVGGGS